MSTSSAPVRPIIIVTGANNGIGFGICHRLLHNILQNNTTPDDASSLFPRSGAEGEPQGIEYPCAGLTLIMACRSRQRAEDARKKLLQLFEDDVARFLLENSGRGAETERRRVEKFCENLVVAVHLLDLASVQSTLSFADEVARIYPYISHLICNAGVAPFVGISWSLLLRQLWRDMVDLNLLRFVVYPTYTIQRKGFMSDDGLGWTWQCNVFGHYILCRALEAKLAASRTGPGRVVWMSSYMAEVHTYDADDWQLVNSSDPYEGTKFHMDLIRAELSRRAGPSSQVRHFTVDPGGVNTTISAALDKGLMTYIKIFLLYIVRSVVRQFHSNITPWNGASAAVYVCLAPLAFIPAFWSAAGVPIAQGEKEQNGDALPLCLHSVTDRRGRNSVAVTPFYAWPQHEKEASRLVDRCEKLYQSFVTTGGKLQQ
ncbi:hypothetical protein BGY98DRAFT_920852 [Russula aff. rugulosa BPL654]|nr:hypothetical protein BGY98DRAFT_920852 [Russula aff. rugulosa BPL654]